MKKISAILVCLLLVASLAVTAFAASAEMTITPAKTEVTRGETVEFTIAISELANAKAAGFCLADNDGELYDTNVFEFVGGAHLDTSAFMGSVSDASGKPTGTMAYMTAVTLSGNIFTFQMKVLDNAPFGETTLTIVPSANDGAAVDVIANTVTLKVVCAEHTPETKVTKEATCSAEGEKVTTCTTCNETIKTEAIAKLPHTEETKVTKEATCSAEGEKVTTCTVCSEVVKTEKIEKLAHTLGEYTETKAPTCAAAGEKTATCSVCQEVVTEAVEALPHTWDEGTVTTAATTKKEGVKTYTCTVCKGTKTEVLPKLETPATGDNTMIIAFVALMVLSAAGVAVTVIGKKKFA